MIKGGIQVHPKLLWESYGRPGGTFPTSNCLHVEGLEMRKELNGQLVEVRDWDAERGRFVVGLAECSEQLLVRPSHLRAPDVCDLDAWSSSESLLDLPSFLALRVALGLAARTCAALSGTSRGMRLALWRGLEAQALWVTLLQRGHGAVAEWIWSDWRSRSRPGRTCIESPAG
ncbi:unnamed protein product [Effrenium voratum]|uniref:Uncharacterized protein n=1 Tax=Effrenium voratum TaxID=2562239 RepID=A0AA36HWH3_9DINO|nr:unnamed protein product [Effrenium voratum]